MRSNLLSTNMKSAGGFPLRFWLLSFDNGAALPAFYTTVVVGEGRWGAAPNPAKGTVPLWNPIYGYWD